ncbi:MAG: phage portal protein [Solirubrobacteraceae bacterium]|nr:phage portal protein [Solirubrobacteraceae bacterium]
MARKWNLGFSRRREPAPAAERSAYFGYGGHEYMLQPSLASTGPVERPAAYGDLAYALQTNPAVFAVCDVRSKALGEARFQWRSMVDGRPGKFFDTGELARLQSPWRGAHTRDLIHRLVQDVDLAGNAYVVRSGAGLRRLRPDRVVVVVAADGGDPNAIDASVVGYQYHPNGVGSSTDEIVNLLPEEVAHWMPTPDPGARFRGMSWLRSVLVEVVADGEISEYKGRFFRNGATVSTVLTMPDGVVGEAFDVAVAKFQAAHGSPENAHKPLFLRYGADMKTIGADPQSTEMKVLQGGSETRIAAAGGVPPVIAGFSEGLSSTSYAAYDASRRRFADYTLRPLLGSLAEALETLLDKPDADAFLTYDPREISHFQEDTKDQADIQHAEAATLGSLFMAGFTPESAVEAITSGDLSRLVHTGVLSAQVLPETVDDESGPSDEENDA